MKTVKRKRQCNNRKRRKTSRPKGCSNSNLDNLWAAKVKVDGECELCKAGYSGGGKLTAHHFYRRRNYSTRWYVPNGIPLCVNHHTGNKFSAHLNPAWFQKQMEKIRGEGWLEELIQRAAIVFHWQKHLLGIKEYLNGEREDYL